LVKRLLSADDIAERYQVSKKTASRYMRKMPHMEKPLRVTEQAVEAWELGRMVEPDGSRVNRTWNVRSQEGIIYIERRRKAT
jgi:predicted DNA-binding transcriptional regulator YafY